MAQGNNMKLIPALVLMAFAGTASASGFALQNQSGSSNGNAFAGAAAAAEDASTIFFNPAGMTYLPEGHSVALAGTVLKRSVEFSDKGTTPLTAGLYQLGTNGGNAGGVKLIPAGYYSISVSPELRVGLGISPTFGNRTEYDSNFMGRFAAYSSDMHQTNINPSIAYRLNDKVSLGGGLNFAYNELEFLAMSPVGGGAERKTSVNLNGWAIGYNLGAMFQLSPAMRVGLSYRSQTKFDNLDGSVITNGVSNTIARAKLVMPSTTSMAVSQKLSDRWEMLGDVTWTRWSSVGNLAALNNATSSIILQVPYNFVNTWRVGLGANYQFNDAWKLRFGVARDKAPVPGDANRTVTLPDSDRTWLSFGAKWNLSRQNSLDFGYSHIFFKNASNDYAVATAAGGTQTIRGDFKTSADLLSLQYNHSF